MATALSEPEIGTWYRDIQNRVFEVIAMDDDDAIEVQYFDGDIGELDRETWDLLYVTVVADPGLGYSFVDDETVDENEQLPHDALKPVSWDNMVEELDG